MARNYWSRQKSKWISKACENIHNITSWWNMQKSFLQIHSIFKEVASAMLGSILQVHPMGTQRKEVFGKMGRKQQEQTLNGDQKKPEAVIQTHRPRYQEWGNKCRLGWDTSRRSCLIATFEGLCLGASWYAFRHLGVSTANIHQGLLSSESIKLPPQYIPPLKTCRESELARTGWQAHSANVVMISKNN